jgi:hypothetical protein
MKPTRQVLEGEEPAASSAFSCPAAYLFIINCQTPFYIVRYVGANGHLDIQDRWQPRKGLFS